MLKVLIADDEAKVCKLIKYLIDWEEQGFEIVGVVNDGIAALEFVKKGTVDLVISDIRMPGYNGLELISRIKEYDSNIQFIIISGYSHFDYAQSAIKYGVEDYLLKPLKKKELVAALQKVAQKQRSIKETKETAQILMNRITTDKFKVKQNFLNELLHDPETSKNQYSYEQVNKEYYYNFTEGIYQVAIIKPLLSFDKKREKKAGKMLLSKALEITRRELEGICQEIVCAISKESVYCVFNGGQDEIKSVHKQLKKIRTEIIQLKDVFTDISVYIAVGSEVNNFNNFFVSMKDAKLAIRTRLCQGYENFIKAGDIPAAIQQKTQLVDSKFKTNFLKNIEVLDFDKMNECLIGIKERVIQSQIKNGDMLYHIYCEIIDTYNFGIRNYGIVLPDEHGYETIISEFELYNNIEEMFQNLTDYMVGGLKSWGEKKRLQESKPIRMAKQYMNEHYFMPLTLEMVSGQIGFNPAYFSSLFKKETTMNFSEYLIQIRLQNAKMLLLNYESDIVDVAEAVGYTDMKYFSKLFKKMTGLSPTEFKKLYQ